MEQFNQARDRLGEIEDRIRQTLPRGWSASFNEDKTIGIHASFEVNQDGTASPLPTGYDDSEIPF